MTKGSEAAAVSLSCDPVCNVEAIRGLDAGTAVEISGTVLTIRDASAKRLAGLIETGAPLPVALRDVILYAVGPSPAKPGQVIGSAGPTTTARLSAYLPALLEAGILGIIGKGELSAATVACLVEHQAIYFAAIGGLGALLGKTIQAATVVAFDDLGPEAIFRLEVTKLPAVVIVDATGRNFHATTRDAWRRPPSLSS
jgi:fumarate hydratase subunit beta